MNLLNFNKRTGLVSHPTMSAVNVLAPSLDFAETIMEKYASNKIGISETDFELFLKDYPGIFSSFLSIFHESDWKEYIPYGKSSSLCFQSKEKSCKKVLSGGLFMYDNDIKKESYGIIRNNLFILYSSDRLLVIDVIHLSGISFKLENNRCKLYQYTSNNCRIEFESRSDTKIETWAESLKNAGGIRKFGDLYDLRDRIGHGKFSDVHMIIEKSTNQTWAVKIIKIKKQTRIERELIHNEISILKLLNSKYIISIKEVFCNCNHTLIIEEYLDRGSLDKRLETLDEPDINLIVRQLLEALTYIHDSGVIHRDIKLENIVFCNLNCTDIKLIDFGLSCFIVPGKVYRDMCGTIGYTAPEIHSGQGYGQSVDVWSVGVVTYYLLLKKMPFRGNSQTDIIQSTLNDLPDFSKLEKFSTEAVNFVKFILEKNPNLRPTAAQALEHTWFNNLQ
jgi:tRNA A-37 threonylcarbamoyl transferase component Bud32